MNKIKKISDMPDHIKPIFIKMFDKVGAPYDLELVDDWYCKYEWSQKQEDEFKHWFIQYHWKGAGKNGKGVVQKYAKTKKAITQAYSWFILDYGWKTK